MSMRKINRAVKSKEITLPAPIWGLNRKDPISAMEPLYAITMDNYIPMDSKVELRPGFTSYVRMGTAGEKVKTLAAYHRPSYDALFAIYNNKIWNITNPASVTDMGVSLSNSYVQTLQYKDYMFFVNGADTPLVYYIDNNKEKSKELAIKAYSLSQNTTIGKNELYKLKYIEALYAICSKPFEKRIETGVKSLAYYSDRIRSICSDLDDTDDKLRELIAIQMDLEKISPFPTTAYMECVSSIFFFSINDNEKKKEVIALPSDFGVMYEEYKDKIELHIGFEMEYI